MNGRGGLAKKTWNEMAGGELWWWRNFWKTPHVTFDDKSVLVGGLKYSTTQDVIYKQSHTGFVPVLLQSMMHMEVNITRGQLAFLLCGSK